jgi:hypothetical protein
MGYCKLYYALLDLKKVVISVCFNNTLNLSLLTISLCIFVNYIFLINFFCFFSWQAHISFACLP